MDQRLNTAPYTADSYDSHILITIPYVQEFYHQTATIIRQYGALNGRLLDLGCGTGMLEKKLREEFPELSIVAADPSAAMLEAAKNKRIPDIEYRTGRSQDLSVEEEYDIITAIESHHFFKPQERETVTGRVFRALKNDGIYICFENVIPDEADDYLKQNELSRWQTFQTDAGKPEEEAELHRARCGVYYFPITVKEHIRLLKEAGFRYVYVFWKSYMQMGILGVKKE